MASGHEPVFLDNFGNGLPSVLKQMTEIAGLSLMVAMVATEDVLDATLVASVLAEQKIDAVIRECSSGA